MKRHWTVAEYETHFSVKMGPETLVKTPCKSDKDRETAELICRAVNAHADLVAALDELLAWSENQSGPGAKDCKAHVHARAALELAKGAK